MDSPELLPPRPMACQECGTVWYSRLADSVTASDVLGRCAKCGGRLALADADVPVVEITRPDADPEAEAEPDAV